MVDSPGQLSAPIPRFESRWGRHTGGDARGRTRNRKHLRVRPSQSVPLRPLVTFPNGAATAADMDEFFVP
jgi:hypothetical protein